MARTGLRLAMWSGPRNISTAMMRSWGSRPDTVVCDEPLYAHYLAVTGLDHPGADEVVAHHDTDWRRVTERLTGPIPDGKAVFYQKHMTHHLLPEIELDWLESLEHCFLIRRPEAMLASLSRKLGRPRIEETGLPQQVELFERVAASSGKTPPVLDARDVLTDPQRLLRAVCERLSLPWDPAMLSWAPGFRQTDGIWAKHWYENVAASSGFQPYVDRPIELPADVAPLLPECERLYDRMHAHRLI